MYEGELIVSGTFEAEFSCASCLRQQNHKLVGRPDLTSVEDPVCFDILVERGSAPSLVCQSPSPLLKIGSDPDRD